MNNVIDSLAATAVAVVIVGAAPNLAGAFEKAPLNPVHLGRADGVIVFPEKETESQHPAKFNVMLRGYDPVAYFKQGKAVRGKRSIWSTYKGVHYFLPLKLIRPSLIGVPVSLNHSTAGSAQTVWQKGEKSNSDPTVFIIHKGKL